MSLPPDNLEDDLLAAEYALRLLDADAMLGVRGRLPSEPDLAAAVDAWDARLIGLADQIAPVQPSPGIWERIEAVIRSRSHDAAVVPLAPRMWQRTSTWITAIAASLALVVGTWVFNRSAPPPVAQSEPARPLYASLASEGGPSLANARYDVAGRVLVVTPAGLTTMPGRSRELWVVPADGRPRSLGLIAPGPALRIVLADDLAAAFADGPTLAISTEAEGGSRTGQPGGPIIASAKLLRTSPSARS